MYVIVRSRSHDVPGATVWVEGGQWAELAYLISGQAKPCVFASEREAEYVRTQLRSDAAVVGDLVELEDVVGRKF